MYLRAFARTLEAFGHCPLPREMQSNWGLGFCCSATAKKEEAGSAPGDSSSSNGVLLLLLLVLLMMTLSKEGEVKSANAGPSTSSTTSKANGATCKHRV